MRFSTCLALITGLLVLTNTLHAQVNTLGSTSSFGTPLIEDAPAPAETATEAPAAGRTGSALLLDVATAGGADVLLKLLDDDNFTVPAGAPEVAAAIEVLTAYVSPLPVSQAEENWRGYAALLRLDPENTSYSAKAERYKQAFYAVRHSVLGTLKKTQDDFAGITWYEHPDAPQYPNVRSYIEIYMGEKQGRVSMRLRVSYTNDKWLFVNEAKVNIDGAFETLTAPEWQRDNARGDVWEYIDVPLDTNLRSIVTRIANSTQTIIRFDGRQYYDDMTVRNSDKKVIREMFEAEAALKGMLASN